MTVVDTAIAACPAIRPADRGAYRADIDGLRGIAVLAVVLTHAGVPGFAGGFIGVDVFFVISGYLITRNLENAPPLGWRDLRAFYGRRMRRTLPALYLVVLVTLGLATVILLPGEFDDLAQSVIATLLFIPNILFLTQAGYFDHAAVAKPLLHTWSLGVEEQFYLVAPLLSYGLRRLQRPWRKAALLGLFALALAFCVGLRAVAATTAFYLMPARLWEFLAGSLVAERVLPEIQWSWLAEAAGAGALVVLGTTIAMFSANTTHPGLPTLLPCLATAALIYLGGTRTTLAGRLLGSPVLAGIGLISYSIYLWHWPLLVLAQTTGWMLAPVGELGAGVALLGLSALSWRLVEVPFRAPRSFCRREAVTILLTGASALGAFSAIVISARGLPDRFSPEVASVASYYDYAYRLPYREGRCFLSSKYDSRHFDRAACLQVSPAKTNILILGDSYAADLWFGLDTVFKGANIMQATASGCKPLLESTGKRYCTDLMKEVMHDVLPRQSVDVILISASWAYADAAGLPATISSLQRYARKVVVVGPVPTHSEALPLLLARGLLKGSGQIVTDHQSPWLFELDQAFKDAVPTQDYISLIDGLCHRGTCTVYAAPGIPLQFDQGHLTSEGSVAVARYIAKTGALSLP